MSALFRKTGIIFTALLLIAATGGYSVYRHYCECQDVLTTSVFLEMECEHERHASQPPSCCSSDPHEMSCCPAENEGNESQSCPVGDCCHTLIEFLKIDDSYTPAQAKISLEITALTTQLFEHEILLIENDPETSGALFSDPSPPSSGRQKLLEIHQLKLSPAELA